MKRLCFYKADGKDVVRNKPEYDELWEHCFKLEEQMQQTTEMIAELEEETEAYQKDINDFCNKRYFGCLEDADKKLTKLEQKCKWQDKEIELDGEKMKALEEENAKLKEQLKMALGNIQNITKAVHIYESTLTEFEEKEEWVE